MLKWTANHRTLGVSPIFRKLVNLVVPSLTDGKCWIFSRLTELNCKPPEKYQKKSPKPKSPLKISITKQNQFPLDTKASQILF